MKKSSDKYIGKNTWVSSSVYNHGIVEKEVLFGLRDMIALSMPVFEKLLSLPEDIIFRLATHRKFSGLYYQNSHTILIDPRFSYMPFLEILAHELVHAEQYYDGRLSADFKNGKWYNVWQGKLFPAREFSIKTELSYDEYRNQPWEKEAFGREKDLAKKVIIEVNNKYFRNK